MRTACTLLALTLLTLPSAPAVGQNVLHELHGEVFREFPGNNLILIRDPDCP